MRHPLAERDAAIPAAVTAPDGETYPVARDGTIDCPDDVAEQLRAVWSDRYGTGAGGGGCWDHDPPFDPSELTVDELDARLSETVDDLHDGEVGALVEAEKAGEARTTALDTIERHFAAAVERYHEQSED